MNQCISIIIYIVKQQMVRHGNMHRSLVCWFRKPCIDNHRLRVNWSSTSKLKFYASQQWLAGAVARLDTRPSSQHDFGLCVRHALWSIHGGMVLLIPKWKPSLSLCYGYSSLPTILKPSSLDWCIPHISHEQNLQ